MSRVTGIRYQSHSAAEADTLFPPTPRYSAAAARLAGGGGGIRYIAGAGTPGRDRVAPEPVEAGGPKQSKGKPNPNAARKAAVASVRSAISGALGGMFGGNKNVTAPQDTYESVDANSDSDQIDTTGTNPGASADDERPTEDNNNQYMDLLQKVIDGKDKDAITNLENHINEHTNNKSASLKLAKNLLDSGNDYNRVRDKFVAQFEAFKNYVLENLSNTTYTLQPIDQINQSEEQVTGGGGSEQQLSPKELPAALENMIKNLSTLLDSRNQVVDELLGKVSTALGMAGTVMENESMYAGAIEKLIKSFAEKANEVDTLTKRQKELLEKHETAKQEAAAKLQQAKDAAAAAAAQHKQEKDAADAAAAKLRKENEEAAAAAERLLQAKNQADEQLQREKAAAEAKRLERLAVNPVFSDSTRIPKFTPPPGIVDAIGIAESK